MKQKVAEMHQKMEQQNMPGQSFNNNSDKQPDTSKKPVSDDYIEFEEIK